MPDPTPINRELPDTFTTDNIMKVQQGMKGSEVLALFGKPKNVSQSVCGADTGHQWTCTTWEYGKFPYDRATFTFSGDGQESFRLNHFDIDRN